MTYPWQLAKQALADLGLPAFEQLVGNYIAKGAYVWSSPTEFILACPVRMIARGAIMLHDDTSPDTWFVHLVAATRDNTQALARFVTLAPYALPYVAWHRRKLFRRYTWESFMRRIGAVKCEVSHGNEHRHTATA